MSRISTDDFLTFCRSLEGREITTRAGHSKFTVRALGDGLEYTPLSSNEPRKHERRFIERILDRFYKTNGDFITATYLDLTMHASYALTLIGLYLQQSPPSVIAISSGGTDLLEGTLREVSLSVCERNPEARKRCIQHYGCRCAVCDFDFERVYGELGSGFIHVHHLNPISEIREQYVIDPIADLRPICPNCHAMIHREAKILRIEDLRELIHKNVQVAYALQANPA
jgi:hypothetical protein